MSTELLGLLKAATGEPNGSLHSSIGRWRQRISQLVGDLIANGIAAAAKPFVQTQYSEGGGQVGITGGTDIVFDEAGYGTIPYDTTTGEFALSANKSYRLTASFVLSNYSGEAVNIGIEWVDADTNTVLHAGHVALLTPVTNTNDLNFQPTTDTFHQTGGAAQNVKLRVTSSTGSADALGGLSFALVQEL